MVEQPLPLGFPLPLLGQVQDQSPGSAGDPGRDGHHFPPDRRGGGPGQPGGGDDPGSTGEVERDDRQHEPGGVRVEDP